MKGSLLAGELVTVKAVGDNGGQASAGELGT